ncbi:MAG: hypothetical protein RBS78_00545 [Coriobacteriia bacterium]|nr:hypothetical protein [Coriobacteriia bacterium]
MKIALIHHRVRDDAAADADALIAAARAACAAGAEAIVCPRVPSLAGLSAEEREDLIARVDGCVEGAALLVAFGAEDREARIVESVLGRTALVAGDACLDENVVRALIAERLDAVVWRVGAESELQAEAILEYALACSPGLAGLLLLAECSGGTGPDRCRGISAIIHAGELLDESTSSQDDLLLADLVLPIAAPDPDLMLPELPPILAQRLAVHTGRRVPVDYPADLS